MAAKGAQRVKEDSSDSDDSMSGDRPAFSSEETALPDNLLKNSEEFIRLYEKHQPELQQLIKYLEKSLDEFLAKYETATRSSRTGGIVGAAGAVGTGAALLLAPFTGGASLVLIWPGSLTAAVGGGTKRFIGNKNKQKQEKKAVDELENALKKFNTTTDRVTNRLINVCNDVEKILQYQNDEQSRSIKHGIKQIKKSAEDLSELAKIFTSVDLRRLLKQGTQTIDIQTNAELGIAVLLSMHSFIHIFEDNKTLRDLDKLKAQSSVEEAKLESKAGKFIFKMRETNKQLQNTLNELKTSKSEVERVIIPNLNQYVKQQRETHKSAESD